MYLTNKKGNIEMKKIIVYGTQYGTTEKYAEELARRINVPAVSFERVESLDGYESVIYIGALYAGGVLGMAKTLKKANSHNQEFIIITVGLADPNDEENTKNIQNGIAKQLPLEILEKASIYHLRGGIDYSKLNFKHKTMMSLLYKKARSLPEDKKTAEVRAMIDTYNQVVDFVDFSSLEPIVELLTPEKKLTKEQDGYSR